MTGIATLLDSVTWFFLKELIPTYSAGGIGLRTIFQVPAFATM